MNDWHEDEAKAECLDLRIKVRELEAALQSIKDDYEFCESEGVAGDRAHAYYETVCKALTKDN